MSDDNQLQALPPIALRKMKRRRKYKRVKEKPVRTPEEQAKIDARCAKARAAKAPAAPKPEPKPPKSDAEKRLASAVLVKKMHVAQEEKRSGQIAEEAAPSDPVEIILNAIKSNPEVASFVTCWQLVQAGIQLPRMEMDAADAAMRKAQQMYRDGTKPKPAKRGDNVFFHVADIGDIIAALAIIKHMGGGSIVIGPLPNRPMSGRESMRGARYEALRPLLESQPYVKSVEWVEEKPEGAVDFSDFRKNHVPGDNLLKWQSRHVGLDNVPEDPWLTVDPIAGPAIFARSHRYNNPRFPHRVCFDKHPDAVFIGTADEHAAFQQHLGCSIPHRKTADFLEVARLMAGCERAFVGQSAPLWCALGVGAPIAMEVCPDESIQNCIIVRENIRFIGRVDQAHGAPNGRKNWY